MRTVRTYDQYCAIARGLELVGDRWTLLIVRELLTGPKRYGALLDGLPGIATNLLADRLRMLEDAGVVARPGAARGRPYELTDHGRKLEPVLLAIARWATPLLGSPRADDEYRLRWLLLTLRAQFDPAAAGGRTRVFEFRVADEVVHVRIAGGRAQPGEGGADAPDAVLEADRDAFLAWGTGRRTAHQALDDGLRVLGSDGRPHASPVAVLEEIRALFGGGGAAD